MKKGRRKKSETLIFISLNQSCSTPYTTSFLLRMARPLLSLHLLTFGLLSHGSTGTSLNCTSCPAGYFCDDPEAIPQPCEVGYYSGGGATVCEACTPGYRCPEASASATPAGSECPSGTYCNPARTLIECPAGTYGETHRNHSITCNVCWYTGGECSSLSSWVNAPLCQDAARMNRQLYVIQSFMTPL